jgi:hypothetical protein
MTSKHTLKQRHTETVPFTAELNLLQSTWQTPPTHLGEAHRDCVGTGHHPGRVLARRRRRIQDTCTIDVKLDPKLPCQFPDGIDVVCGHYDAAAEVVGVLEGDAGCRRTVLLR